MLAQHDILLTVLNAILLAYGEGPDKRLAIANAYYNGHQRREVDIINHGDRIIVRLVPLPVTEEEPDAEAEG